MDLWCNVATVAGSGIDRTPAEAEHRQLGRGARKSTVCAYSA
jgi:hypothetical protein